MRITLTNQYLKILLSRNYFFVLFDKIVVVFFVFFWYRILHIQVIFVKVMETDIAILSATGIIPSVWIDIDWIQYKQNIMNGEQMTNAKTAQ